MPAYQRSKFKGCVVSQKSTPNEVVRLVPGARLSVTQQTSIIHPTMHSLLENVTLFMTQHRQEVPPQNLYSEEEILYDRTQYRNNILEMRCTHQQERSHGPPGQPGVSVQNVTNKIKCTLVKLMSGFPHIFKKHFPHFFKTFSILN